jgi:hypothetical protein
VKSFSHAVRSRIAALPLALAAACIVYVALRWLIVDTSFDQVALWMYEPYPMGTLAELAIRRVDFPLRFYYDNAAGQILAGFLTVPSFLAFGPTYLALKVVPFALGFATLLLLYGFLRANFGRTAAIAGAFLFTLGPPTLVKYSVICSGNHFENLFFSLLAIACWYRSQKTPESARWLFATAVSAGFALFVFLGAIIPVGILVGMHVGVRGLRRSVRDLLVALPGFALGISPLVLLNLLTNARGLGFIQAKFGDEGGATHGDVGTRFLEFLGVHLPRAGVYEPFAGLSGEVLGYAFLAGFVVAYVLCAPEAARGIATLFRGVARARASPSEHARAFERVKLVPFLLYLPLAALAYGLSNFRVGGHAPPIEVAGYRYFLPYFLFAIVLIAVVFARLWERGGPARAAGTLVCAPLLFIGGSNLTLVDWSYAHAHLGQYYDGYDLPKIARGLLSKRNDLTIEERISRLEGFPPLIRQRVTRALGFNLGVLEIERKRGSPEQPRDFPNWHLDLTRVIAGYPERMRDEIARGAGIALRFDAEHRRDVDVLPSAVLRTWDIAKSPAGVHMIALVEGTCMTNPLLPLESQTEGVLAGNRAMIARATGSAYATMWARGQGLLCGLLVRRGIPSDVSRVTAEWRALDTELRAPFCVGYGMGLAEGGEEPAVSSAMLDLVPTDMRPNVWRGFGARLRDVYDRDGARRARAFEPGLTPEEDRALMDGVGGADER